MSALILVILVSTLSFAVGLFLGIRATTAHYKASYERLQALVYDLVSTEPEKKLKIVK